MVLIFSNELAVLFIILFSEYKNGLNIRLLACCSLSVLVYA